MKNIFNQKPLPEKVIVRLEEILFQLLPVLEESVADGRAVDAELSTWLRANQFFAIFAGWDGQELI